MNLMDLSCEDSSACKQARDLHEGGRVNSADFNIHLCPLHRAALEIERIARLKVRGEENDTIVSLIYSARRITEG